MGTATGFTAERMLAMEAATVVGGELRTDGHLYLQKHDSSEIDAGSVVLTMALLRDLLYPVGHIYMSADEVSPEVKFGGTWVPWGEGRVPIGVSASDPDFDESDKTGGQKEVKLTAAQSGLPLHNHTQNAHTHLQDAHNHTQNAHTHLQDAHNHTQNAHNHTPNATFVVGGLGGYGVSGIPNGVSGWGSYGSAHWYSIASTAATNQSATATNQSATATNESATATNQSATAVNNPAGPFDASEAHENLPPYVTCYMWKRTA